MPPPSIVGLLVVDDEPLILDLLKKALPLFGFRVFAAASAAEAAAVYAAHRAEIGLALVDVLLSGEDGLAALARLQAIDPAVRCCFMTGDSGMAVFPRLMAAGAPDVFIKPFEVGALAAALHRLLREESYAGGSGFRAAANLS